MRPRFTIIKWWSATPQLKQPATRKIFSSRTEAERVKAELERAMPGRCFAIQEKRNKTMTQRIGDFRVESLGVEYPEYFQGYGLGPDFLYAYCAYGIGATEAEALDSCLDMVVEQGFNVDTETEARIREAYGPVDAKTTVTKGIRNPAYFHIGIQWDRQGME